MKTIILILLCVSLAACDYRTEKQKQQGSMLLSDYRCTEQQLEMVKKELEICNSTNLSSSYCFNTSKKSNCDAIGDTHEKD